MAAILVGAFKIYWLVGLAFAAWFAWRGAGRLDPVAANGSWGFRLLVIPGAAALWPYLLVRIAAGGPAPPEERNAHRLQARARAIR